MKPNKKENKFCSSCKMVLSYNSYSETIHQEKLKKDSEIYELKEKYENDLNLFKEETNNKFAQILSLIQQNPLFVNVKPEVLTKMIENN
jgi:hypothetical protein